VPLLNIFFIKASSSVGISLFIERKKMEDKIEIQEAENKLKEPQKE